MRFILLTNPSHTNNVLKELILSGLVPEFVVTDTPFYVKEAGVLQTIILKVKRYIKYLLKKTEFKQKFKPYFLAKKHSIPVYNSNQVNTKAFKEIIKHHQIDYVFTYGFRILKDFIIEAPRLGCINFHPAFLPNNRGASPTNWVLLNGQNSTGITFHYINEAIDEGQIIEQYEVPITGLETTELLNKYLFGLGELLLVRLIINLKNSKNIALLNNDPKLGSYEKPFKKEHRLIQDGLNYNELQNLILSSRAYNTSAIYRFNNQEHYIVNVVKANNWQLETKFPFLDNENNIYVETPDGHIACLITNKKTEV